LADWQVFIDMGSKIFAQRFSAPFVVLHGDTAQTPKRKEKKMLNRKMVIVVFVAVLVGWMGVINSNAADVKKININTASAEELTQLKGIGSSHAANIIEFREKNGPFKNPEDLIKVPRIGRRTFEKNKDLIIIQNSKKKQAKK
jgi:competence protein ComEA